ncbi:hypothetical protein SASPL_131106 [Salvia splendens]|uniref:Uncharacterized protein n=1 Tax=Salvia splendens TaxID=180675 RepID=A0A8X8ZKP4_SALSN|nr:hypothetical protein SASPL_131106 [Salvia splendens]
MIPVDMFRQAPRQKAAAKPIMATTNLGMEAKMHLQELNLTMDPGRNPSCLFKTLTFSYNKDDRERIIVRRFKLEELRIEEIQDLEVSALF